MSTTTPTVAQTATNLENQFTAHLQSTLRFLPKSFLSVVAKVLAATFIIVWKRVDFLAQQRFARYASTKPITLIGKTFVPLEVIGVQIGAGPRDAATRAILDVTVEVLNQVGFLEPGETLVRTESGVTYVTTGRVALTSATVTARVRAASAPNGSDGTGTQGNLKVGDKISFVSPLPAVKRVATVSAVVVVAADAQDWEEYRQVVIDYEQAKPQGGAYADYRAWARAVPGIVTAYPYTGYPGQVDVYIEATVASSGSPDGVPTAEQITAVAEAIAGNATGQPTVRPANGGVNVKPITRTGFIVAISGFTGSDELKLQIRDALISYYRSREPFIVGLSVLPRKDRCLESTVIGIVDELVNASGATVGTIRQKISTAEQPNYTLAFGEKAKFLYVDWV